MEARILLFPLKIIIIIIIINKLTITKLKLDLDVCFVLLRHCLISLALILQEIEVNLIITDYCMPEMTGYDLLRKIKASFFFFFSRHRLNFLVGFLLFKPFFLFSLLLNLKRKFPIWFCRNLTHLKTFLL